MLRRCAVAAILCLTVSRVGLAEIWVTLSLEWLADHCRDSGAYVVTDVRRLPDLIDCYEVVLTRKRVCRGTPPERVTASYSPQRWSKSARESVLVGDAFLVCFQHYESGEARPVQLINLDNPGLQFPTFVSVSSKMQLMNARESILAVFEGRLAAHPHVDPAPVGDRSKGTLVEIDPGAEPFSAVWGGSTTYLRVPKDLEQTAIEANRAASLVAGAPVDIRISGEHATTKDAGPRGERPYMWWLLASGFIVAGAVVTASVLLRRRRAT